MIFREMTMKDASAVCWSDLHGAENDSVVGYFSPESQAKELFDYSVEAWSLIGKDGEPKAICGLTRISRTTLTAWCVICSKERKVWGCLAKAARAIARRHFSKHSAERIHALACMDRPEPLKFLQKLGMNVLCRMDRYGAHGKDFSLLAITKEEWEQL